VRKVRKKKKEFSYSGTAAATTLDRWTTFSLIGEEEGKQRVEGAFCSEEKEEREGENRNE